MALRDAYVHAQTKALGSEMSRTARLAYMIAVLAICRLIASTLLPVYDDAFITFRYARNLAEGAGFVYHAGERVLGTTAPGFGVFTAALYATGLPVPGSVLLFNILFDFLTLGVTVAALHGRYPRNAAMFFGALFALHPVLARITVGRMEMSAFLACAVLAIHWYHRGHARRAVVLAAAAYFLRPEAVMLVGLLCLQQWFVSKRNAGVMAALAVLTVAPALAAIYAYYGSILPQSVVAKSGELATPVGEVLRKLLFNNAIAFALLPFALWGVRAGWRSGGFVGTISLWALAWLAAYLVARPTIWTWYGAPLHYAETLLAAIGISDLLGRLTDTRMIHYVSRAAAVAPAAAVLLWIPLLIRFGPSPVTTHLYAAVERWCAAHDRRGRTTFAHDIGAIGYYCPNSHIYDLHGLVGHEAVEDKDLEAAIREFTPDYVYLTATEQYVSLMQSPWLRRNYRATARFAPNPGASADVRQPFARYWVQDYLLFERVR